MPVFLRAFPLGSRTVNQTSAQSSVTARLNPFLQDNNRSASRMGLDAIFAGTHICGGQGDRALPARDAGVYLWRKILREPHHGFERPVPLPQPRDLGFPVPHPLA